MQRARDGKGCGHEAKVGVLEVIRAVGFGIASRNIQVHCHIIALPVCVCAIYISVHVCCMCAYTEESMQVNKLHVGLCIV